MLHRCFPLCAPPGPPHSGETSRGLPKQSTGWCHVRPTRDHPVSDGLRSWLATAVLLTASAAAVLVQAGPAFAATTTLYAAPNGTGTACSASQPCSLIQAKTNVAINGSMTVDITIMLADGTHRRDRAQVTQNVALQRSAVPRALWDHLHDRGLIRQDVPTTVGGVP